MNELFSNRTFYTIFFLLELTFPFHFPQNK